MTHEDAIKVLVDAGFEAGWAMAGDILILWQHDADPPAPFTRPEVSDVVAD
jgi:hypothetical protein